jgi:hypothetical protein
MGPTSDQAASLVIQGRQFDLQPAFAGPGALAEDFQDQAGTVNDLAFPGLFQIALLNRGQRGIDDDQGDFSLAFRCFWFVVVDEMAEALDGAGAEKCCRAGPAQGHDFGMGDREINGVRQADGFVQELFLPSYPGR